MSECIWHNNQTGTKLFLQGDTVYKRYNLRTTELFENVGPFREINIQARFRSDHILTCSALSIQTGSLITTSPLAKNWHDFASDPEFHNPGNVLRIFYSLLCTLQIMHRNNFLHLDVKHDNIIFVEDDLQPLLIDYDCVQYCQDIHKGTVIYNDPTTLVYRPPERWTKSKMRVNYADDIWSLGFTILHIFDIKTLLDYDEDIRSLHSNIHRICSAKYIKKMMSDYGFVGSELKEITHLLTTMLGPKKNRPTVCECLSNPLFMSIFNLNISYTVETRPDIIIRKDKQPRQFLEQEIIKIKGPKVRRAIRNLYWFGVNVFPYISPANIFSAAAELVCSVLSTDHQMIRSDMSTVSKYRNRNFLFSFLIAARGIIV